MCSLSLCLFLDPLLAWALSFWARSDQAESIEWACFGTAGIGYVPMLTIFARPLIAGRSRARMAAIFGPWLRATLVLTGHSTLAHAVLLDWVLLAIGLKFGSLHESIERMSSTRLAVIDQSARNLLDEVAQLEEDLSLLEAKWLLQIGAASLPKGPSGEGCDPAVQVSQQEEITS